MKMSKIRRRRMISIGVFCTLLAAWIFYRGASQNVAQQHHGLGQLSVTDQNYGTDQHYETDQHRETGQHYVTNQHFGTASTSRTKPPFYPVNGTGQTVNISADFDTTRFQEFCKMGAGLEVIVPVYSAPGNFERRTAMRETFGKVCSRARCKMFFIVGVSLDKCVYDKVKEEYATVNDILIVNKVDTYRDLNNKVVAMLDWLIAHCSEPKYVIRIIDDFFPNLKSVIVQLRAITTTRFVLGTILSESTPFRHPGNKWFVSKDEYPYRVFPTYVSGVVYAFLNTDSVALRQNIHQVEYCWIDDVWLGHVVIGSGFQYIGLHRNYKDNAFRSIKQLKYIWNNHVGIHHVNPSQFYGIYYTVGSR